MIPQFHTKIGQVHRSDKADAASVFDGQLTGVAFIALVGHGREDEGTAIRSLEEYPAGPRRGTQRESVVTSGQRGIRPANVIGQSEFALEDILGGGRARGCADGDQSECGDCNDAGEFGSHGEALFLDLNFVELFGASFLERTPNKEHLAGREEQRFKREVRF